MATRSVQTFQNGVLVDSRQVGIPDEVDREERLRAGSATQVAELENVVATKAAWDALTAAQRQEATRRGLLMLARLARLVLHKLNADV